MAGQTNFQLLLRSVTVLLLVVSLSEAQTTETTQPPTTDPLIRDLQFTLPIVSIFIIIVIILAIIICVVYKARYGQFCCLKPRMRFRPPSSHGSDEEGEAGDQQGLSLPKYPSHPTREIAPPDYQDAMQDMLVSSGGPDHPEVSETSAPTAEPPASEEETTPTSEPEPAEISDESFEYDDRTPLNP